MTRSDDSRPDDLLVLGAHPAEDNRLLLGVVSLLGGVLSVLAALQAVFALGMLSQTLRGVDADPALDVLVRVGINLAAIGLAVALLAVLRPERHRRNRRWLTTVALTASVALVRCLLQVLAGVYPPTAVAALAIEFAVGATVVTLICAFGFLLVRTTRRVRAEERAHGRVLVQAVEAVQALQEEELRVRREVAQHLHGSLQNSLVVLASEIRTAASAPLDQQRLERIADRLDELREREVRAASGALHPVDIEHGLVPAVRDLIARLPAEIAVDIDVAPAFDLLGADGIPLDRRVLLARAVEEGLTNALKHGEAGAVGLALDVESAPSATVVVRLDDDGRGVAPEAPRSGLDRLSRQFAVYGGSLELLPSPDLGGARLAVRLPLHGLRPGPRLLHPSPPLGQTTARDESHRGTSPEL